jgi:hypothetical protein
LAIFRQKQKDWWGVGTSAVFFTGEISPEREIENKILKKMELFFRVSIARSEPKKQ